ncbi:MAG TPA: POTRA domain-containing protein [Pyrinomonadaceae bacterium]|jgi:outer membrane protein assembly factor BamA|nr:POTRA domain-containing protein [Pyrinomonadaceae bacterium]
MLFGYAEQHQFTVRRVEFIGNTYTRDRTLRIQMDELNEGNVFTIAALNRCLVRLSKVRNINNVTVKDVDIRLNHLYGILDLTITLTDTSRAPRRR